MNSVSSKAKSFKVGVRKTHILRDLSGHWFCGMGRDGAPNITSRREHAKLVSAVEANEIMARFGRCNFRSYKAKAA